MSARGSTKAPKYPNDPKPLKAKPVNPKPLNPQPLNPKPLSPKLFSILKGGLQARFVRGQGLMRVLGDLGLRVSVLWGLGFRGLWVHGFGV